MGLEISRRLIPGVGWRTRAGEEPSGGGNGGSQTVEIVRVPVAFDDDGIVPAPLPITAVSIEDETLTVAGDHTIAFPVGRNFVVKGSTGNDSTYEVVDSAFSAGHTVITVPPDNLSDPTADGDVYAMTGVAVWTPSLGDALAAAVPSLSTAWDGTSPTGYLFREGAIQPSGDVNAFSSVDMTQQDSDVTNGTDGGVVQPVGTIGSSAWTGQPPIFRATTRMMFVIDDGGNFGDPGSTMGEGEIMLLIYKAQS